jgi:hypothetical protein
MLLGGLWHGAAWNFVVWGGLYGIFQMVSFASKRLRKNIVRKTRLQRLPRLHSALRIFITFNLVSFAWIFFRAASFNDALVYIRRLGFEMPESLNGHLLYGLVLLLIFLTLEYFYKNKDRIVFWQRLPWQAKTAALAFSCCLMIVFSVDSSNEFIYFQF